MTGARDMSVELFFVTALSFDSTTLLFIERQRRKVTFERESHKQNEKKRRIQNKTYVSIIKRPKTHHNFQVILELRFSQRGYQACTIYCDEISRNAPHST